MIEATKGAYTLSDLDTMPFHELLDIWEAVNYSGCLRWLASQPAKYVRQEPKD